VASPSENAGYRPVHPKSFRAVHGRDVLGAKSESKSQKRKCGIVDARRPAHDDQNLLRNKNNQ
jgi:hypothetical protein